MDVSPGPGGSAPAAPLTDRLFFALLPDAVTAERAEAMAIELGAAHGVKPRRDARARFHVTLFHLGDFSGLPQAVVAQACQVAEVLRASPFDVTLDRLTSFAGSPRRQPHVLLCTTSPALMAFQADMQARMVASGLTHGRQHRRYTPHLTLLYGRHPLPESTIEPLIWTAHDFVLIRSLIGQGRHEELGRWPLRAPG